MILLVGRGTLYVGRTMVGPVEYKVSVRADASEGERPWGTIRGKDEHLELALDAQDASIIRDDSGHRMRVRLFDHTSGQCQIEVTGSVGPTGGRLR